MRLWQLQPLTVHKSAHYCNVALSWNGRLSLANGRTSSRDLKEVLCDNLAGVESWQFARQDILASEKCKCFSGLSLGTIFIIEWHSIGMSFGGETPP